MLRTLKGLAVAAVFLVASIATLFFARNSAPSFQRCYASEYHTIGGQSETGVAAFLERGLAPECTARFLEGHNAVITAIATVLLTFVTGGLVWTGYQQIRTVRAQLRAYITTTPGECYRQGGVRGLRFECRPLILNTGQTPAYKVGAISNIKFLSIDEAKTFDFNLPPGDLTVTTLGPSQSRFTQVIMDGRLSKQELRQFRRGTHRLFVYGKISYRDAFGRGRYTHYCYVIGWWNKRHAAMWHHTNRHNDSD